MFWHIKNLLYAPIVCNGEYIVCDLANSGAYLVVYACVYLYAYHV